MHAQIRSCIHTYIYICYQSIDTNRGENHVPWFKFVSYIWNHMRHLFIKHRCFVDACILFDSTQNIQDPFQYDIKDCLSRFWDSHQKDKTIMRTPCSYDEKPQTSKMAHFLENDACFFFLIRTRTSDLASFDSCFFNGGITVQYSKS